ncbi:MAG TPA: GMP synthase subunit A [Archaeoglobaceae archaeon]|nr:GMP synthase subunit A [Archaeoglobaceae archaeon]
MVKIYVVYNFGQYNHLIHRTLRDLEVDTKLVENTTPVENLMDADGIVLGGGPSLEKIGKCGDYLREIDVPFLGICLGHQLMAELFGGEVGRGETGGYAEVRVRIVEEDEIFEGLPTELKVWASHADEVKKLPSDFKLLATSDVCNIEAMRHKSKSIYGIQWHPEVFHTEKGEDFYKNFVKICRR